MDLPSDRKALIFSAGGVRLALRLSHLREIVPAPAEGGEIGARGETYPTAFVSTVLGLPSGDTRYALLTEGTPRMALRVEALHGIIDLADAEFFQLPVPTPLPQPPPFSGAVVSRGEVALELAVSTLGFAPLEPAVENPEPPPDLGPFSERELRFSRAGMCFAVPLSMLVQVLEEPRLAPVPLTPPSHRGLLYHGRSLHPVVDLATVYQVPAAGGGRTVLLVDAGGAGVGVLADRVLGVGEGGPDVVRPPWDTLFGA
ncbi:MAG TPA: chemotaxis protein CheW [Anaeromyxobacter sp.]|nr:chemotaxis protein CheW [Anaeromyxobacter sp.]